MTQTDVYAELMEKLHSSKSEYLRRILQKLVTPEEGRLLLDLPDEPAALARKWGLDENTVNSKLQEFQERGLAVKTRKGVQFDRDVVQLHDSTLSSPEKWVDTELLDLWKEFHEAIMTQSMSGARQRDLKSG